MPAAKKATDKQILIAYGNTLSVHRAAEALGMCGQSVHERLIKLNIPRQNPHFTKAENDILIKRYEGFADLGKLNVLAAKMGRSKHLIARQARRLGITDQCRPRPYLVESSGSFFRKWHKNNNHPRGMLGKTHSSKTKDAQSQRAFDRWHSMSKQDQIMVFSKLKRSWKAGWRTVGQKKCYFRSSWEANYARYLEWLRSRGDIKSWQHEPQTFWFEAIRRGTRSYLPDFKVIEKNGDEVFHEVKGWMDPASKTKIKRMAKYYPRVKLIIIDGKCYRSIASKIGRAIPGWE